MTDTTAAADMSPADKLRAACALLGLTLRTEFVPFSQSRNRTNDPGNKPGSRSLNWRVTLERDGRDVLTTDYSAGVAHCPSYKQGMRWTLENTRAITHETERGTRSVGTFSYLGGGKQILPDAPSVIHALVMDASVLDAAGFEEWAMELGYDPDSRAAEVIYRACLETALKLRAAIGDAGIEALRTAGEDF